MNRHVRLRVDPHVRRGNDRDACAQGELAAAANLFRKVGREPGCEHVHRRLGLRHGGALAQTGFHEQGRDDRGGVAHPRHGVQLTQCGNRQPEIRDETDVERAAVIGGTDADDRHRHAFNPDDASDDGGVRAEHAGPRLMPEDGDQRSPGPLLRRVEPAAERRPESQDVEIGRRRVLGGSTANAAFVEIAGGNRDRGGHRRRKDVGVLRHLLVGVIRDDDERLARGIVLIDVDEAIGVGERLVTEQHRVHDAEDRGVGADGEAEDQHRRRGETPIAHQAAEAVARVARQLVDGHRPARVAARLLDLLDAAE